MTHRITIVLDDDIYRALQIRLSQIILKGGKNSFSKLINDLLRYLLDDVK